MKNDSDDMDLRKAIHRAEMQAQKSERKMQKMLLLHRIILAYLSFSAAVTCALLEQWYPFGGFLLGSLAFGGVLKNTLSVLKSIRKFPKP
ncbi:MAG: hypothetical protein AAF998_17640 [Bacteroidota bacterium]